MISVTRAKKILDCYGSEPSNWPAQEHDDLQQLLANSEHLKEIYKQTQSLDNYMGFSHQANNSLANSIAVKCCADKILANLPEQPTLIDHRKKNSANFFAVKWQFFSMHHPVLLFASIVLMVFSLFSNIQIENLENDPKLTLSEYLELYVSDVIEIEAKDEELEILAFLEPQIMDEYN